MVIVHGLKNCDSCRAAKKKLSELGAEVNLNDIGAQATPPDVIGSWISAIGAERLINRKSATWRSLDPASRALAESDPTALLSSNPKVMKRPLIELSDGSLWLGVSEKLIAKLSNT